MMFHLFVPRVPWNQWSHSAKGLMSAHVFAAGATEYAGAVREHVQGRRLRDRESAVRHSCPRPHAPTRARLHRSSNILSRLHN